MIGWPTLVRSYTQLRRCAHIWEDKGSEREIWLANSISATGKQIILLQASLALVQNPTAYAQPSKPDPFERLPYDSAALKGLEVLSQNTRSQLTRKKQMSALARHYGINEVMRWVPRMVCAEMYAAKKLPLTKRSSNTTWLNLELTRYTPMLCTQSLEPLHSSTEAKLQTRSSVIESWSPWVSKSAEALDQQCGK